MKRENRAGEKPSIVTISLDEASQVIDFIKRSAAEIEEKFKNGIILFRQENYNTVKLNPTEKSFWSHDDVFSSLTGELNIRFKWMYGRVYRVCSEKF